jgi:predicted aspartyl protease
MVERAGTILAGLLLAATCAHAADAPRCAYVELARMPVRYLGPGLAPGVDGTLEGKPATMLIDTGDYNTQLTMTGVVKRNLPLYMSGREVEGVSGSSALYTTRVQDFAVGPVHNARRLEVDVIYDMASPPDYDAIIGAPFLLQSDFEVDLNARQIKFYRAQNCSNTPLYLWKEGTIAVPFDGGVDGRTLNPHFSVFVNGTELDAVIDTGAHNTLIDVGAARRAGIDMNGPGVKRLGDAGGVGADRVPHWSARVNTVTIGTETIRDAEIGVLESRGNMDTDMLLGQDFLRTHRVLFAMSQRKLYLAYLGGQPFSRVERIEPWIEQEAERGNPDAQYRLAMAYGSAEDTPGNRELAAAWLAKAAANGQPHANRMIGRRLLAQDKPREAIPVLRAALDGLPADRYGALWLYQARLRTGDAALAKSELEASEKAHHDQQWPYPVTQFYLGRWDEARVLKAAGDDRARAHAHTCSAREYMAEWYAAGGDKARADALEAAARAQCGAGIASAK